MPNTVLAFDFGHRRIGVAVGQDVTGSASPLGVVRNSESGVDRDHIATLIQEWQPTTLVVGKPLRADGSDSDMTEDAARFAKGLEDFELPVVMTDERFSSVEATRQLKQARAAGQRGRISKEDIDAAAAVTIAERYLAGSG
ncbi:MAG: Holliday junction resolvase RuvX [Pseudomonadota bacterium]